MRKKIAFLLAAAGYLASSASAFAINIQPPTNVGLASTTSPSVIITSALTIAYIVAVIVVLFFIVYGAFNWITSGGEKEKVGKARGLIVNALIGLALLALAVVIVTVVGRILNIDVFQNFAVPKLNGGVSNI